METDYLTTVLRKAEDSAYRISPNDLWLRRVTIIEILEARLDERISYDGDYRAKLLENEINSPQMRKDLRMNYSFEILNVSAGRFASLIDRLKEGGAQVESSDTPNMEWSVKAFGVSAVVKYEWDKDTVHVSILEKPMIVPVGFIKQKVMEALNAEGV